MSFGRLNCLAPDKPVYALAFLATHATAAIAFCLLAASLGWAMLRTRSARLRLLGELTDGRRLAAANLFSAAWVVIVLIFLGGADKVILLGTSLGIPYTVKVVASVVLAGVAGEAARRVLLLCWRLRAALKAPAPA